jgi:glycerol-3-phosphate dehydrogenase (NAD(P)+)
MRPSRRASSPADLDAALAEGADILVVVPSHAFREVLTRIAPNWIAGVDSPGRPRAWRWRAANCCIRSPTKSCGASLHRAVISGPTFAREVAAGLPTAATVASADAAAAEYFAARLRGSTFRAYTSSDVIGVELGGALKNVLAIAAGISDGLGFGANSRAALITRGLAEMIRLGEALGGQRETFMGLAGVGDLVLTCDRRPVAQPPHGPGAGPRPEREQAHQAIGQVVEGVDTAREIHKLGKQYGVDLPISEQVYQVLSTRASIRMRPCTRCWREPKAETA